MKGNERETSLYGAQTCGKDDPQIALRGEIDCLHAQAVYVCSYAKQYGYEDITGGLEDIIRVVRELMRAEATGQAPEVNYIMGMDLDEIRHASHNVESELGLEPYMPDEFTDDMTALVNILRADIRRAERACACTEQNPVNETILLYLNRLSSAAYILMLENRAVRS